MRLLGLLGLLLAPACDAFAWAPRHTHNSRILYSAHLRPRRSAAATGSRSWRCDLPVTLRTPLGIVFEEVQPGEPKGLIVANLVSRSLLSYPHGAYFVTACKFCANTTSLAHSKSYRHMHSARCKQWHEFKRYMCIYICIYIRVSGCGCVCAGVCAYVSVGVYIYTYIRI